MIGPIPWGHTGPLCHALSLLSSSWTSMRRRHATVVTPGEWQCKTARSGEWAQHFSNASCYYCMLATHITTIGFSWDADHLIQITGHREPPQANVWHSSDTTLTFLDRTRPTCTRALMEVQLPETKATCRYMIHKPPYPRSVSKLHGNTFLLTNITKLRFNCPTQWFDNNNTEHIINLKAIKTIYRFVIAT